MAGRVNNTMKPFALHTRLNLCRMKRLRMSWRESFTTHAAWKILRNITCGPLIRHTNAGVGWQKSNISKKDIRSTSYDWNRLERNYHPLSLPPRLPPREEVAHSISPAS